MEYNFIIHSSFICNLFNDAESNSVIRYSVELLDGSEYWIGKDIEGVGHGLIWGLVSAFALSDWGNYESPQSV
jgi:hypothetical protein